MSLPTIEGERPLLHSLEIVMFRFGWYIGRCSLGQACRHAGRPPTRSCVLLGAFGVWSTPSALGALVQSIHNGCNRAVGVSVHRLCTYVCTILVNTYTQEDVCTRLHTRGDFDDDGFVYHSWCVQQQRRSGASGQVDPRLGARSGDDVSGVHM